jgi:hypothetical protein
MTPEDEKRAERTAEKIGGIVKERQRDPRVGDYLREHAKGTWTAKDGVECFIVQHELEGFARLCVILGHEPMLPQYWWCGYVRLNQQLFTEMGYDGLLTYVPCPGGITCKAMDSEGCHIYGYDTNHAWDHEKGEGYWTAERMTEETTLFARALVVAAKYEQAYLQADGDCDARAKIIDDYHKALAVDGVTFNLTENFGAMMNALFGRL